MMRGRGGIVRTTCFNEQLSLGPMDTHSTRECCGERGSDATAGSDRTVAPAQQRQRCERHSHQGPLTGVTQRNGCTEACLCYFTEERNMQALQAECPHPNTGPCPLDAAV